MSTLRISLFGRLQIRTACTCVHTLGVGKADELLCYLLLRRARPVWREKLAAVLWSMSSESQGRTYLRRALWQLRTALNEVCATDEPPGLVGEPDWVHFRVCDAVWVDAHDFADVARTVAQGAVDPATLDAVTVEQMEEAVALYQGDLLESYYHDWCLYPRQHLRLLHLLLLDAIVAHHEAHGRIGKAMLYAERTLEHDRTREQTYRQLMRLCLRAVDRGRALRTYERCVAVLDAEFGVPPSMRTQDLYACAQSERPGLVVESPGAPGRRSAPSVGADPSRRVHVMPSGDGDASVVGSLRYLLDVLDDTSQRSASEVEALEGRTEDDSV